MFVLEYFKFQKDKFDKDGFHIETKQWFNDLIGEFEIEFHSKHPNYFANYFFCKQFNNEDA